MTLDLAKYGVTQTATPASTGATLDLSKYGVTGTVKSPAASTPSQSFADTIWQNLTGGLKQAAQGYNTAVNANDPLTLLEGSVAIPAGLINAAASPLAPVLNPLGEFINTATKPIQHNAAVQRFAMSKAGETTSRVTQDIANLDTIAGAVAAPDAGGAGTSAVKAAVTDTPEAAAAKTLSTQQAAATKAANAIDTEVRNTAAKYPTVNKVLNAAETQRNTDPVAVLASYSKGQALPELVKGKLQVDSAVKFLQTQVSRLSEIKNQLVSNSKETTSVNDFRQAALDRINTQNWSAAKRAAETSQVNRLLNGLEETYPDGIPNSEMDLLKTEHANESKSYNSKSPFSPDAHAIVGQAARDIVETNGGSAPINELNKWISSHYDAIKLLNSMRGKTPHGGIFSREAGRIGGEIIGMGAGIAIGHPFLGAMAGRAGADTISEIVNSHFISNPLKRSLINNMKGADPEVVQKALDFLNAQSGESTRPAPAEIPATQ